MNAHLPDSQIEQQLRAALDRHARTTVPDTTSPPPMDWDAPTERRRDPVADGRTRRFALLGGVAAALIAVAAVAGTQLPHDPSAPGTGPTIPGRTASITTGSGPTSGTPNRPKGTLGGAKVVLPDGWVATPMPSSIGGPDTWCLGPRGTTARSVPECPVAFHRYHPDYAPPDPDMIYGNDGSTTKHCGQDSPDATELVESATSSLGGRPAGYRRWTILCPQGRLDVAQYVVADAPAYELLSLQASTAIRAKMAAIARESGLPAALSEESGPTAPDAGVLVQGRVEHVTASGYGFVLRLRSYTGAHVDQWKATDRVTTYRLPSALFDPAWPGGSLEGQLVQLRVDGDEVTQVIIPGG